MKKLSGIIIKLLLMLLIVTVTLESCSRRSLAVITVPTGCLASLPKDGKNQNQIQGTWYKQEKTYCPSFPFCTKSLVLYSARLNAEPLNALHAEPSTFPALNFEPRTPNEPRW